jgi:putative flavoprotein involved in K+ transport
MREVAAIVIGAGHAGLAMSRRLTERSIDHLVLERGEVANSWRTERWDSLRLLTPNWQSRLPGLVAEAADPDGYRGMPEVIALISGYAQAIAAPVLTGTQVTSVRRAEAAYEVVTTRGHWRSRSVVIATGACQVPCVPQLAAAVPSAIAMLTPHDYRNPDRLPDGGVLVVGAGATGVQLAEEIHHSGRPVILAVGEHVRVPRTYRGRDILWWMDRAGLFDQRRDEVDDLDRARRLPSFQLVGSPERRNVDLNALAAQGIELVGRVAGIRDGRLQFSGALRNHCQLADLKLNRLLDTIDAAAPGPAGGRPEPTRVSARPRLELDLRRGEIAAIVWAVGYRPDCGWLEVPVLDHKGRLRHDGGVVAAPGLYAMGLPFMRRRK